ncbi:MAG: hypothetical protein IJX77_06130 [Ruminococcus sp.]|nr:hypothetical protein [Ruminococcus sp.]
MAEYHSKFKGAEIDELLDQAAENRDGIAVIKQDIEKINSSLGDKVSTAELQAHCDSAGLHTDAESQERWNTAAERAAIGRTALGYTRKKLLKNTAVTTTKQGITFTVNDDGSVTADGTATASATLDIGKITLETGKSFVLSGCPEGGATDTYSMFGLYTANWIGLGGYDTGEGLMFTASSYGEIVFRINIKKDVTVSGLTFYPMVRYAEISDETYEQYKLSIEERLSALEAASASTTEGGE